MNKKSKNGDAPATQHDLEVWGGHLSARIDSNDNRLDAVEEQLVEIKEELKSHRKIFESILNVLDSIQGQLKVMFHIPEKVERHEERITGLEVKVRIMQK